jgi:UDP-N-acetylglucosamine--N-acetylmuramyl-(pentapeptide) pyrophosphoryl-undecaprenol N-acetylglucosamine transferase
MTERSVLLAAGGTGGHLFPAQALAAELVRRGIGVELATDMRAERYGGQFPGHRIHLIRSETLRGNSPMRLAKTFGTLAIGFLDAWRLLGRLRPAVVVGFGGYPTLPPVLAAAFRNVPTVIHEQNGVMGRANRLLARRVRAIATSFPGAVDHHAALAAKATMTGNPVRPAVIDASNRPFPLLEPDGPMRLVVFGGSQGARIMADVVPAAIATLAPGLRRRLAIVQQAREEDGGRVREAYAVAGLTAEVASFFPDLPERIAAAHLVISRAGASTVAELAAIGRPGILVPLPHALDQDQLANATVLAQAGAAVILKQSEFTPARLAQELTGLMSRPAHLAEMAAAARAVGRLDASARLADLVLRVAKLS